MNSSRQHQSQNDGKKQRRCLGKLAKIILILFFAAYLSLGAYAFLLIESSTQQQNKQHSNQPAMTTTTSGGGGVVTVHHQHTPPTEEIRSADLVEGIRIINATAGGGGDLATLLLAEQDQMTRQVLDRLWDITENLNILYKENWTRLAAEEVGRLHESMRQQLMQAVAIGNRRSGAKAAECNISKSAANSHQSMVVVQQQQHHQPSSPAVKWNYPTAFLYALSVITTLGELLALYSIHCTHKYRSIDYFTLLPTPPFLLLSLNRVKL
jgi:hypothetical protein